MTVKESLEYIAECVPLLHQCGYSIDSMTIHTLSNGLTNVGLELVSKTKDEYEAYVLKNLGESKFEGDFTELIDSCRVVINAFKKLESHELEKIGLVTGFKYE